MLAIVTFKLRYVLDLLQLRLLLIYYDFAYLFPYMHN